ncbi:hypothetical protein CPSG_06753 [Coccidioides posadasii str. Silveira]|uniref:Uncharacterized protein n=1 Tax=Coccidioides posadasii (strain RMSCC 757 / Silveira) TaxID=443226 RepID=E9DA63_COCPS|nr:hypothetical protein CPSG_06753 [Coccidioides posadasii str. Silveira]
MKSPTHSDACVLLALLVLVTSLLGLAVVPVATNPRLVGLGQPFFVAASPSLAKTNSQIVPPEGEMSLGNKARELVAEDVVNQEFILGMLKIEDVFGVTIAKDG